MVVQCDEHSIEMASFSCNPAYFVHILVSISAYTPLTVAGLLNNGPGLKSDSMDVLLGGWKESMMLIELTLLRTANCKFTRVGSMLTNWASMASYVSAPGSGLSKSFPWMYFWNFVFLTDAEEKIFWTKKNVFPWNLRPVPTISRNTAIISTENDMKELKCKEKFLTFHSVRRTPSVSRCPPIGNETHKQAAVLLSYHCDGLVAVGTHCIISDHRCFMTEWGLMNFYVDIFTSKRRRWSLNMLIDLHVWLYPRRETLLSALIMHAMKNCQGWRPNTRNWRRVTKSRTKTRLVLLAISHWRVLTRKLIDTPQ